MSKKNSQSHNGEKLSRWTTEQSADLYNIRNWGAGYFDISSRGEIVVTPPGIEKKQGVSLLEIITGIKERGLDTPVLLRIQNLLHSQISRLHTSFNKAIKDFNYKGKYRGIYPIKVNQQQQVIEEITRFGRSFHHGLEAGSKAELIAAIAMIQDPEACLVCNGYKDAEFIDLGLYAMKLGYKCFFVIEMVNELPLILSRAKMMGIKPRIGVRIKLSARGGGHWAESGGDRSLFGLNTSGIIHIIDTLKEQGMLECLQLLHYHIGSQIPNIRDIRSGVAEASRFYAELVGEGAPMGYLDLGGGLAVDYDGSKTNFPASCNYSLDEYCADIIEVIMANLDDKNIPHPTLITESGRATVAYCSILLFDILETSRFEAMPLPEVLPDSVHEMVVNLKEVYESISLKNIQECYNDALYYRSELVILFTHGQISMREKAIGENFFWSILQKIVKTIGKVKQRPIELEDIEDALSDIYYGNFSIFQSLPDSWAIEQLFPVMPLHRLNELPSRQAILADITCDSDGKIEKFIDLRDVRHTLPVHELKQGEDYYLGVFLVGAYQETLGDLHNLLGDTNVVTVRIDDNGTYEIVSELEGDSVADVLSYVEYDPARLQIMIRETAERAVQKGQITGAERKQIMKAFKEGLSGYTYFER